MKIWYWTGIMRSKVRIDIHQLRRYSVTLRNALQNELQNLEQIIERKVDKMNKAERDEYYDFVEEEHWELREVFPNFAYASILITLWSLLAHSTLSLARRIGSSRGLKIKPNDLKDKGLKQARSYFDKVLEIPYPNSNKWQEIMHLNKIRNLIIHSDGIIPQDNQYDDLRAYVKKTNGINIDGINRIQVDAEYCLHIIKFIEKYIFELIANCEKVGEKDL